MVLVVGGGASGLMAACSAALALGGEIAVLEKNDRVGKKLLATGNGRCNLTNLGASPSCYHGKSPEFAFQALKMFGPKETLDYFHSIGLVTREEEDGRIYPRCGQASAVLDVLRNELSRKGARILVGEAKSLRVRGGRFSVLTDNGQHWADKVIIATGGKASSALGSDGSGYPLLQSLGHEILPAYPALAPIETTSAHAKALSGLRVKGTASIERGGKTVSSRAGEILFASGRLSGIAIMDLAIYARELPCDVCIDLMPEMSESEVANFLIDRAAQLSDLLAEQFFIGCFQRMLGQVIIKSAGVEASMPVSQLSRNHMEALARQIKRLRFPVLSVAGFKSAQATLGGAATSGFCPDTCESLSVKGLFAAGEVLDICGDCGGFNLQWAWSSGWVAGRAAAKDVLQNRK